MRVFLVLALRPQNRIPPLKKSERKIERRQIKLDIVIAHHGQCPHQVSLNLANPHFQGLTRFLSQGLLNVTLLDLVAAVVSLSLQVVLFKLQQLLKQDK